MAHRRVNRPVSLFDVAAFLAMVGIGEKVLAVKKNKILFSQGDASDAVFYIVEGKVKLIVVSSRGKEAVVAVLGPAHFFGEACLAAQPVRTATATSTMAARIIRIEKAAMARALHQEKAFSERFMSDLLSRNTGMEEDLVDQLFDPIEKRLARALLLLARFGKENRAEAIRPKINQETLAEMIGISRSKVTFFMTRFKKRGFIDDVGGLRVHRSLLNIVLND